MVLENKSGQFGRKMWGEPQGPPREYSLPPKAKKPEVKKTEVPKGTTGSSVLKKQEFFEKKSLMGILKGREDFYKDTNIQMGEAQRKKFAEKLKNLLPPNKTTFNPGDIRAIYKKLGKEQSSFRGTPEESVIKKEREALKKLFGLQK